MSPFVRNMLTVLRGTVVGQLIVFAALPLLSRVFPPEAFGTLQSIQALLAVLLIVCSLRLEIAILSATEAELPHLLFLCGALCLATSAIVLLAVTLAWLLGWRWLAPFGHIAFLLPGCLLFAGAGQILSYLGLRVMAFGVTATARIVQSLVYTAAAFTLGAVWPGALALVSADVAGRAALVSVSLRGEIRSRLLQRHINRRAIMAAFRAHINLPLMSMPSAVINVLGSSFTAVMLLALFDNREAGNYAIVERLLGAPVGVVAGAASQAYMAAISQAKTSAQNQALLVGILKSNAALAIVPTLVLMLAAPTLVPWLLGSQWTSAGSYAQILAPLIYVSFIATPVNMTLVLSGRQAWQLTWDATRLGAVSAMWWLVHKFQWDAQTAIIAFTATSCVFYAIHVALSYRALSDGTRAPPRLGGGASR